MFDIIAPNWPAAKKIKAFSTTRYGGFSQGPLASLNFGLSVKDNYETVLKNRMLLREKLHLPSEPCWIKQVHGVEVVEATDHFSLVNADASYTHQNNIVCVVLSADCLPIFLCDRQATTVAAIHAGWRGLAAGVVEQTIKALQIPSSELMAWLGPAIGPEKFEVQADVMEKFITVDAQAEQAFKVFTSDSWLANIYLLAKQRLEKCGITAIYGGDYCTYSDPQRFFSHRRDQHTGRMANVIWINQT